MGNKEYTVTIVISAESEADAYVKLSELIAIEPDFRHLKESVNDLIVERTDEGVLEDE